MRTYLKTKIAVISAALLGVIFATQNCGMTSKTQHAYPPSPFEDSKVLFSNEFAIQEKLVDANGNDLSGSAIIAAGTELSVIVRDKCIRDRQASASPIPFWIDSYITTQTPLGGETEIFSETAVGLTTKVPFSVDQLNTYAKLDPCIVGISNTTKIAYRTASNPASIQADLLSALNFAAADTIFKNEIPSTVKVRVAILDSGVDYTNTTIAAKVDSSYSLFFDFLGTMVGAAASKGNQDVFGTGTQLASLMVGDSARSYKGLAENNVVLLPIKIRNDINQTFGSYQYLNMIKLAVNMRADVINLATSDVSEGCDPIVGHAMLQAVRRNAFIVLSAGDNIEPNATKPRRPGAFVTVKDNGPLYTGVTVAPGCWGRYLKGVITVSASNMQGSALASFSNWGEDAVEVAAPGLSIRSVHNNKTVVNSDSIVLPTAMVSAAAAMTIAYHKAKTWSYDPWLIEDVILNSLPGNAPLMTLIRRGKFLNFSSLANYLKALEAKTPQQRLAEQTDNAELNAGWNQTAAVDANLLAIDVYAKLPMLQTGKRLQLNAVAYYKDAVIKVITEEGTTYTSSNPAVAEVNSQGVLIAKTAGNVRITANYKGLQATASVAIVTYDVVDGPANDLQGLEVSNSFNSSFGVCPVMYNGASQPKISVHALYGDGGRLDVTSLSSLAAPSPVEIARSVSTSYFGAGNWYGGKTYTVYGLYKGQQAHVDIVAPKVAYKRLRLLVNESSAKYINAGETFSIAQNKAVHLSPFIEVNDICNILAGGKGDLDRPLPAEVFSSPDPTLNALLKKMADNVWSATKTPLYSLTPGKTYQIDVKFGNYRGNGIDESIPVQTYFMKIDPFDIKDMHLAQYGQPVPSPFPLGLYRYISLLMEDSQGKKQAVFGDEILVDVVNRDNGQRLQAPRGLAIGGLTNIDFDLWLFPSTGEAANIDLMVTHIPTGFKKTFNLSARGQERYSGADMNAPAFNWSQFSMAANGKSCAQGVSTAMAGLGTTASPYVVCSPQQFIDTGIMSSDVKTAPHVQLGSSLDFTGVILPKKSLIFASLHGGGKTINFLAYASADEDKAVIVTTSISNIEFSEFSISTRSAHLVAATNVENVRFIDGLVLANEHSSYLLGSYLGGTVTPKSVKNVRVENVEMQAMSQIAPIKAGQLTRIENFGARGLVIRGSSVAGAGSNVGGVTDSCFLCTIVSSSTSGQISQVATNVGGIAGEVRMGRLISVTSDMNIAATTDKVGGLVGNMLGIYSYGVSESVDPYRNWSIIYNSSFSGTVRAKNKVGGIAGASENSSFEKVSVSSSALVQGVDAVGGVLGESATFNRFYDATVDASLYSAGKLHPITNSYKLSTYTFRPADRFSNLKFKGFSINLEPELLVSLLPPNSPINTMPAPLLPPMQTPVQLGLTFAVQGATLSNGVYVLNLGSLAKDAAPIFRNVQITGSTPFHFYGGNNTASIAFTGTTNIGVSGTGYTNWGFGIGLPTNTVGAVNTTSTFVFQTASGKTELKIQVIGTITAP